MRIISNFHDYYDVVQAQGQDQSLVYVREPKDVVQHKAYSRWRGRSKLHILREGTIGFCGKLYPVMEVSGTYVSGPNKVCYSIEDVDAFVEANYKQREVDGYYGERYNKHWVSPGRKLYKAFFDKKGESHSIFLEHLSPVFVPRVVDGNHVRTFNGCLKDWEFYRVVDPYTAFQEIAMFLGGLAQPEKPIPEVSDKDMLTAKGFDQWSFKKPPKK